MIDSPKHRLLHVGRLPPADQGLWHASQRMVIEKRQAIWEILDARQLFYRIRDGLFARADFARGVPVPDTEENREAVEEWR